MVLESFASVPLMVEVPPSSIEAGASNAGALFFSLKADCSWGWKIIMMMSFVCESVGTVCPSIYVRWVCIVSLARCMRMFILLADLVTALLLVPHKNNPCVVGSRSPETDITNTNMQKHRPGVFHVLLPSQESYPGHLSLEAEPQQ